MLDKLAIIPTATRALIWHTRIFGDPVKVYWNYNDVYFSPLELALDSLTILGPQIPRICYDTLDMFVRHGAGWKELYYLTHDSNFLAYGLDSYDEWFRDQQRYLRMLQPGCWQRVMEEWEGVTSGTPQGPFAQTLPVGKTLKLFGMEVDAAPMMLGERDKEVLVVFRCGRSVYYTKKEDSPYLRRTCKTWSETGRQHAGLGGEEAVVDDYIDVNDYKWPTNRRDPQCIGAKFPINSQKGNPILAHSVVTICKSLEAQATDMATTPPSGFSFLSSYFFSLTPSNPVLDWGHGKERRDAQEHAKNTSPKQAALLVMSSAPQ
ncbi:hypothetical protein B0H14DRAFT_2555811 [Mycena olivaceomarginata]|nr:hypothetical protein B0H14DRAFT_2555811 [Mycena olivaceomarginata]